MFFKTNTQKNYKIKLLTNSNILDGPNPIQTDKNHNQPNPIKSNQTLIGLKIIKIELNDFV